MIHEIFLRSFIPSGTVFFGIEVTNSCFYASGQTIVNVMQLYIEHRGIAKRSENLSNSAGKTSPDTIDFGFLNARMRPAT